MRLKSLVSFPVSVSIFLLFARLIITKYKDLQNIYISQNSSLQIVNTNDTIQQSTTNVTQQNTLDRTSDMSKFQSDLKYSHVQIIEDQVTTAQTQNLEKVGTLKFKRLLPVYCQSMHDIFDGRWITVNDININGDNNYSKYDIYYYEQAQKVDYKVEAIYQPTNCQLFHFEQKHIIDCLQNKQIGFFGDSLLRNVFHRIRMILIGTNGVQMHDKEDEIVNASYKFENDTTIHFKTTGDIWKVTINDTDNGIYQHWAPSLYYSNQHPHETDKHFDIIIQHAGAWDMGTYFRGFNTWRDTLQTVISKGAKLKLQKSISSELKNMIMNHNMYMWFNLHQFYRNRCKIKDGPCYGCNDPVKEVIFRNITQMTIACNDENVVMYDTFNITSNIHDFPAKDGDDAVHFGHSTTLVEAQILLNMVCKRPDGTVLQPTKRASSTQECNQFKQIHFDNVYKQQTNKNGYCR